MGIPSYFSHVVRRHRQIIKMLGKPVEAIHRPPKAEAIHRPQNAEAIHRPQNTETIENLYLDSNSIIYDALRVVENQDTSDFEERLIKQVCQKIDFYIRKIGPTRKVLIAFDGVAPMAKLNQQRTRRYKTWYLSEIKKKVITQQQHSETKWNTSAITPGTSFMEKLSKFINVYPFWKGSNRVKVLILSSDEVGEGEHKIFEYIRAYPEYHKDTTTVIYGLDADLIMLSLNHIDYTKQLYLHRETPEFIKSVDSSLDNEVDYLFCIQTLNRAIREEVPCIGGALSTNPLMGGELSTNPLMGGASAPLIPYTGVVGGTAPYVMMCFFLGNDFLPHFPSLNIRTNGIDKLMNAYKLVKCPPFFTLSNTSANSANSATTFHWKNIRTWIDVLAKQEHDNLKEEYEMRSKYRFPPSNKDDTLEEKYEKLILNMPLREREIEEYINPNEAGWEKRYYRALFDIDITDARRKEICMNYLEGLEWNMKYYTSGCPDWNWCYKYDYPPLLSDLIKYVPYFETTLINPTNIKTYAVSPLVQLSYVLPRASLYLLPDVLHRALLKTHPEWYMYEPNPLVWAYCKYIWESHVKLPEINIKELSKTVEGVVTK